MTTTIITDTDALIATRCAIDKVRATRVARRRADRLARIGLYFSDKWRRRAVESGVFVAAAAMRKQGVPLHIARLVLLGRMS